VGLIAIPVSSKVSAGVTAYVDENAQHLLQYQWFMTSSGHPARALGVGGKKQYLSRAVLGLPEKSPVRIGHIDYDPTNACRSNLCYLFSPRRDHRILADVRQRTFSDTYFVTLSGRWLGDYPTKSAALAVYEAEVAKRPRRGPRLRDYFS
jgi:hypothetical protein